MGEGTTEEYSRLAFLWKPEIDIQEEFCATKIHFRIFADTAWPGSAETAAICA